MTKRRLKQFGVAAPLLGFSIVAFACIQPQGIGYSWNSSVPMNIYIDSSVYSMPAGAGSSPASQVQAAATTWSNFFLTNGSSSSTLPFQLFRLAAMPM